MNSIFTRTSVRTYLDKKVEPDKIEKILRAGFAAPSACNQQPWEFYVVQDKTKLAELAQSSPYAAMTAGAPAAIVICSELEGLPCPEYAEIDCAIAAENILLEIEELGLGGVMLGIAPHEERMQAVRKALDLPEDLKAFTIIPFGYPTGKATQQDRYDANKVHFL